ncbi:MAG: glucokinase [Chloroflexia bacterium]
MYLLAGDIGATKTDLAIFSVEAGPRLPLVLATFPSTAHAGLEALVGAFLAQSSLPVEHAVFGVAGPVLEGRVSTTNLPWEMEEGRLREVLGLRSVHLLNDLEAIASAVPHLEATDLYTLNPGRPTPGGTIAVIAPGTGLGEAFLTWDGARYRPHPSEGGHADFAPRNALEADLWRYLQARLGHVSYERLCSGLGLPNIYAFLKESGRASEPAWLTTRLRAVEDPTPVLIEAALGVRRCEICALALELFVSILGAEAGNLALKVLASGGVYIGGGIPPRILPALQQGNFLEAFRSKGRMEELLARIPVHVILNPRAALLGAACRGLEEMITPTSGGEG